MSVTLTDYKLGVLKGIQVVIEWEGCVFTTDGVFIELIENLDWLKELLHVEKV